MKYRALLSVLAGLMITSPAFCQEKDLSKSLCPPVYTIGCAQADGLIYFDIDGKYNNATGCDNLSGNGWSQYTGMNASLGPGMTYTVTAATGYPNQDLEIWIDFNDDYLLDQSEKILECANLPASGQNFIFQVPIPASATPGQHYLRAMANRQTSGPCPFDPCGSFMYGETEDYMVTILPPNTGDLEGYVYEFGTMNPVSGATIDILGFTATSQANGFYSIAGVPTGTWDATCTHPDYCNATVTGIVILENQTTVQDFTLTWAEISTVPEPSVGYNIVLCENCTQGAWLQVTNNGSGVLDVGFSFEYISASDDKNPPDNNLIAEGKEIQPEEFLKMNTGVPEVLVNNGNVAGETVQVAETSGKTSMTKGEEIFGSDQNIFTDGYRTIGNIYEVSTSSPVWEHRMFMDVPVATQMWFMIYESQTLLGTYTLISASDVSSQAPGGPGWFSSGILLGVEFTAGNFYLVCTSFEEVCSFYNEQNITPYPIPASFGSLVSAAGWDWAPVTSFPPEAIQNIPNLTQEPVACYQTLVTGAPVTWFTLVPGIALTIAPGATQTGQVGTFSAVGLTQGTVRTGILHIYSNAQNNPHIEMPVLMTVGIPIVGDLQGNVYEYGTNTGVAGALLELDDGVSPPQSTTTNASGYLEFIGIYAGTYTLMKVQTLFKKLNKSRDYIYEFL